MPNKIFAWRIVFVFSFGADSYFPVGKTHFWHLLPRPAINLHDAPIFKTLLSFGLPGLKMLILTTGTLDTLPSTWVTRVASNLISVLGSETISPALCTLEGSIERDWRF